MARRLHVYEALAASASEHAAAIRRVPALDIADAVADGVHPLRAALDAAKAHPATLAAREDLRNDRELAITNAVGLLVERTLIEHTRQHGQHLTDREIVPLPAPQDPAPF